MPLLHSVRSAILIGCLLVPALVRGQGALPPPPDQETIELSIVPNPDQPVDPGQSQILGVPFGPGGGPSVGPTPPTQAPFEYGLDTYIVQPGDSLSKIARKLWGDPMLWPMLFGANRHQIQNPNLIYPGQALIVPRVAPQQMAQYRPGPAGPPPPYLRPQPGIIPGPGVSTLSPGFQRWMGEATDYAQRSWRFPQVRNKYGQVITHEDYIKAILYIESKGRHTDASGRVTRSGAGAMGFMQLMPGTARSVGVDPRDPRMNLLGGVGYLATVFNQSPATRTPGESPEDILVKAAAGYNKGPYSRDLARQTWPQFVATSRVRETVRYGITLKMALGLDLSPQEADWISRDRGVSFAGVQYLEAQTYQRAHSVA